MASDQLSLARHSRNEAVPRVQARYTRSSSTRPITACGAATSAWHSRRRRSICCEAGRESDITGSALQRRMRRRRAAVRDRLRRGPGTMFVESSGSENRRITQGVVSSRSACREPVMLAGQRRRLDQVRRASSIRRTTSEEACRRFTPLLSGDAIEAGIGPARACDSRCQ